MTQYLTSKENVALDIVFAILGDERYSNVGKDYSDTIARLPALKVLHGQVNDVLEAWAQVSYPGCQICHFKAGDRYPRYEEFPKSISLETLRSALVKSRMRIEVPRRRRTA